MNHLPKWLENAEAIGVSPEMIAELQAKTEAAEAALAAQQQARRAAEGKTQDFIDALAAMSTIGSGVIHQIRARAATTGPQVYTLALLSPPEKGAPMAPPGKPERFVAELQSIGWLQLRWTCKNPRGSAGTVYQLHRSVDGGPMTYVGVTGEKKFIDQTVPKGASALLYQVQGLRSTQLGALNTFPVTLNVFGKQPAMMMWTPGKRKLYLAA
jgi:hypothetical protein